MKPNAAAPPRELEIKFRLTDEAVAALEAFPALRNDAGRRAWHDVTTYYDTPTGTLARDGISLRVRRRGSRYIQTLKMPSQMSGAFARQEWEWPVTSEQPELKLLMETPLAPRLDELSTLQPLFVTDVRRIAHNIQQDGATIEVSLDRGQLRAPSATTPIRELELELKDGDAESLYRLAATLHASVQMVLGAESKADRGWRLSTGHPPSAVKQSPIEVSAEMTAGEAFQRITESVLAHLLANEPAAEAGDMEGVHQIRVAIRRLRTGLVLFGPLLEPHAKARFTEELRRLGHVFGAARDWDVFCTDTLAAAEQHGVAKAWLDLLRGPAERERAAAHAQVTEELHGLAVTAVVLGLAEWAGDTAALTGDTSGGAARTALADVATDLAGRLARKVQRRGRHITSRRDDELHALRKALKKLRYGVEFLAPLGRRKQVKVYLDGCKALQKHLGAFNDAVVAVTLAEHLGDERRAELAPAVAALAGWAADQQRSARRRLAKDWHAFNEVSLPL